MYNNDEMGRACYNSDEDTEDASESEMPKYEYKYSARHLHHLNHNNHPLQHAQQHPHHLQHHPNNHLNYHYQINNNIMINTNNNNGNNNNNINNNSSNSSNNYTELREQMYLDKLNYLREQLFQLDAGIHPEYIKQLKRVETQRQDRMLLNDAFQIYETERVEREYINEKKAALREFEDRKIELRESLILELEDRRRMIENERSSMELLSDCTDTKPVTTRKLRRRPNEPIPMPDKRRRTSPAQLNHQLDDKEILEDMKALQKAQ